MALTASQIVALNSLPDYVPALATNQTDGVAMTLGTEISALPVALALAAVPTAVANASDLATAIALVNDLKAKYNALVAGIDAL